MGQPADGERRSLRVAMVVCSVYDSDARVRRQAEALAARGDEVHVYALHAPGAPRHEVLHGVHVVHSSARKYRGDSARDYLTLYSRFIAGAAAWLARRPRRFDLVQVHAIPEAIVFAAAAQRATRVPVLLDVHDLTEQLFASKFSATGAVMRAVRLSARGAMAFADEVLTVHEPYAETLRTLTRRPVTVVLNGPDSRWFTRRPFRPWRPGGEVVFGYHGLIAPRHGLVDAVDALHDLRSETPGARLHLLGDGDGLTAVRARVEELGLDGAVHLPEARQPVSEMAARLESVHIGLMPSRLDAWTSEVLPTKLLEYAALGIPVISFHNRVIERYFPPAALTRVDPANRATLLAAMRAVVADPDGARKRAEVAARVAADLGWDHQKQTYFEVIDRMAARRSRTAPRTPQRVRPRAGPETSPEPRPAPPVPDRE